MILCLDVGNSNISGAVFKENDIILTFRIQTSPGRTSDERGVFLRSVLRENAIDYKDIKHAAICSVVPDIDHSLKNALLKYFSIEPFVLKQGIKMKLKIDYKNPAEVGADRIANAIGASSLYENKNIVIVDFGTAITFCGVSKNKDYYGGAISLGIGSSLNALIEYTAKLPKVAIVKPEFACGRGTIENIQSGLYYGHLGAAKEIISRFKSEKFPNEEITIIGTGGFSSLYSCEELFDVTEPNLIFFGLKKAFDMNS